MDNFLTPRKIQRLIYLAEAQSSISFTDAANRMLLPPEAASYLASPAHYTNRSPSSADSAKYNFESSSGILDLEHVEAFGESGVISNMSKSTTFNPGELSGRSTGASEGATRSSALTPPPTEEYGRHSLANIETITNQMNKQTSEIRDIMRHSIASNYSFHSTKKPDLTADEASFISKEAPMPVPQSSNANFGDSVSISNGNFSVGSYFQRRCTDFGTIFGQKDNPDISSNIMPSIIEGDNMSYSMMPSITEVSGHIPSEYNEKQQVIVLDDTLDSVPVRQPRPRSTFTQSKPSNNLLPTQNAQKTSPKKEKPRTEKIPSGSEQETPVPSPRNPKTVNAVHFNGKKKFMSSSKPADVLLKNLHTTFRLVMDETEASGENSLSLSKIADYLGKQSNVSDTDIIQLRANVDDELPVTNLKDTKNTDDASSAGTVNTVINNLEKVNIKEPTVIPKVVITRNSYDSTEDVKQTTVSKSPTSKSPSTLSTVRENYSLEGSPNSSKGEPNRSKIPSPNIVYKELDKSVDWKEVLEMKTAKQRGVAKEQWAEIVATPVEGFVGVNCAVTIKVTTLTDNWLTAKFQFDNLLENGKDLDIDLPRLPLLLSPGKAEQFTFHMTSNVEINSTLPFTVFLKDASVDGHTELKGDLKIKFILPVIQAMSPDGLNKITYGIVKEKSCFTKCFVLISDCAFDLQLKLSIVEGDGLFSIKSVQEINKSVVNKVLVEKKCVNEDRDKSKGKVLNKQLCRLTCGNAIKVTIAFTTPKLSDSQMIKAKASFNGALHVNLITGDTILRKVDLIGSVSTAYLVVNFSGEKLQLCKEPPTEVTVSNTGALAGVWRVACKANENGCPFIVTPSKFEISPGGKRNLHMLYTGPEDCLCEATIILEDIITGRTASLTVTGGSDQKPKSFPVKTTHGNLSWVKAGRKEVSLKNSTDKRIQLRCQIIGEGFSMDLVGVSCILSFDAYQCRQLPISFIPTSNKPCSAMLHLVYDKNMTSRKIRLWGCASGEAMRWSGLVTYSDTALVRAAARAPVDLKLYNKAAMPAFVVARIHFNLQYMTVESSARLIGACRVVASRARHTVSLHVDWTRVERRAREGATTALATVTVLTGAEITRRRILKVLKDESAGELDTSLLPEHLRVLAQPFDGEDLAMDNLLTEFNETKTSLPELIGGLQELTAHIDLPQDFNDENTILITDDTLIDHHTICD